MVFPRIGVHVRPQPGSALIYWNFDSLGQQDPLLVNSDCPVVHGNKWGETKDKTTLITLDLKTLLLRAVALHWINAERKCPKKETW